MIRAFSILLIWIYLISLTVSQAASENENYVGSSSCQNCHQDTYQKWQGSHHDMAMRHADKTSVLGDFNNTEFKFNDKTNLFYTKDNQFWARIEDKDGELKDYQILYTFGFTPLQQYMVELDKGHIQLIPFAWDTRTKEEGGQRWFHLYPNEDKYDNFYWTNKGQNWNFMCADCHSTNLEKNYNPKDNSYKTTWSDINVGCEACHGAGKKHVELATKHSKDATLDWGINYGFSMNLNKAVDNWVLLDNNKTLQPKAIKQTDQVKACAQCHSRRIQLNETQQTTDSDFLNHYQPSLITQELYHDDGQILDENYVYGSFIQTKMHQKGVVCSNCHEPHSTELIMPKEVICSQCHIVSNYSEKNHTFHPSGTKGSNCVDCHMPSTTYMQVDPRRDHSWQIPRPDLSDKIKTPNACTNCHEDKTDRWAFETLQKWFPNSKSQNAPSFASAFYAADHYYQSAGDALSYIAQDNTQANIIRASALDRLARFPSQNSVVAIARAVKHEDPLIRLGSIEASSAYPFEDQYQMLEPLLNDDVLAVRAQAAGTLAPYWQQMTTKQRDQLTPALNDYIEIQNFNQDRGFGRANLGNIYLAKGEIEKAITYYQKAIEIEPIFPNSYINLADIYRAQGDNPKSIDTLLNGIKNQPKSGLLHYSLGLANIRLKEISTALDNLSKATELEPENSQFWYVYALAYENRDIEKTKLGLTKAYTLTGNPQYLYSKCEIEKKHNDPDFEACIKELEKVAPKEAVDQLK